MFSFFLKGGPVMWPLLITSIITLTVVVERFIFLLRERAMRQPRIIEKIFNEVEAGNIEQAILLGDKSSFGLYLRFAYGAWCDWSAVEFDSWA